MKKGTNLKVYSCPNKQDKCLLSNKDEFSASRFFNDDTTVTLARLNSARTDFEIYFCEKVKKKTHLFEMSCQFQKLQVYSNIKKYFRV